MFVLEIKFVFIVSLENLIKIEDVIYNDNYIRLGRVWVFCGKSSEIQKIKNASLEK